MTKAWLVCPVHDDYPVGEPDGLEPYEPAGCEIVFADTRGQAIYHSELRRDGWEFTSLKATRLPDEDEVVAP